jgi:hypothetical protein
VRKGQKAETRQYLRSLTEAAKDFASRAETDID